MFCSKCGKKADEEANYCSFCGAKLASGRQNDSPISYGSDTAATFHGSTRVRLGEEELPSVRLYDSGSKGSGSNPPPTDTNLEGAIPDSAIAGRTKWVRRLLFFYLVVCAASLWGSWTEYGLLKEFSEGAFAAEADADASDNLNAVLGWVQLVYFVVLGVVFLAWIKAASKNVRRLGAQHMLFTPGWSIGWYFVPVLSLWKPYQAMKELWQASENPSDWKSQKAHPILAWWWFFWIASLSIGNAAFRLSMRAEELDQFVVANVVGQVSLGVEILLTFVALKLVTGIGRLQGWASEKIYSES